MKTDGKRIIGRLAVGLGVVAVVALSWYAGARFGASGGEPNADSAAKIYRDVAGEVLQVHPERNVIRVDHERIEGFMAAMVMDLTATDSVDLETVESGDAIRFDLAKVDDAYQVVRIRRADAETPGGGKGSSGASVENPLERGDLVPDLSLYDAGGQRFQLRGMEPERKLITFFYVRCPLENFCPAQSKRLAELQEHLAESDSDVRLVSLSLDAGHDDAEVLAEYAEAFEADPSRWSLAGGEDPEAVRRFADRAGARIRKRDESSQIDHALIGLRVDGDRIVDRVYGLEAIAKMAKQM